jgi:PD-(D/E)XK nuclease superfamily protein
MIGKDKKAARIGLAAHTAILHKLVSMGFEVLQPLSNDLRFDLVYYVEETAELVRIQCKAGRYVPEIGCILFKNYNVTGGRTGKRGYIGDAEYFGVYCAELNKIYLVPVDLIPSLKEVYLRVIPSKNNQMKKVIWARDYEK